MKCDSAESLLLAERDGLLTQAQHAELAAHLATCADCHQLRAGLVDSAALFKAEFSTRSLPDVETEWQAVRAKLASTSKQKKPKRPLAPIVWLSAPLAAAAALAIVFLNPASPLAPSAGTESVSPRSGDTTDAAANTMVYVDNESGWLVVWGAPTPLSSGNG